MESLIPSLLTLGGIGTVAATVLFLVAKKFMVYEDPKIDVVEDALPASNCGGCGYAGCRAFAEACVKADDLETLYCPVGGNDLMKNLALVLNLQAAEKSPKVAVVRCGGSCEHRPKTNTYDGDMNCNMVKTLYSGDTGCSFGCFGCGDCVDVCNFDAIHMNPETMLPEVVENKCTACNACVVECPQDLIELRTKKNKKGMKIYVSCMNQEKGAVAKKSCDVACIGCSKCLKECPYEAIEVNNFLAFIDSDKCKLCRKCVDVCPTNAIVEENFPPKKPKKEPVANA